MHKTYSRSSEWITQCGTFRTALYPHTKCVGTCTLKYGKTSATRQFGVGVYTTLLSAISRTAHSTFARRTRFSLPDANGSRFENNELSLELCRCPEAGKERLEHTNENFWHRRMESAPDNAKVLRWRIPQNVGKVAIQREEDGAMTTGLSGNLCVRSTGLETAVHENPRCAGIGQRGLVYSRRRGSEG